MPATTPTTTPSKNNGKSGRRSRHTHSYPYPYCINLESLLMASLVLVGVMILTVNLFMVNMMEDEEGEFMQTPKTLLASQRQQRKNGGAANKGPILEILKLANVSTDDLTQDEWDRLPSWEQVVQRFGDRPRMIGLETCETYRSNVPLERRHVAPAGMFSTGTNLLHELLHRNCALQNAHRPHKNTGVGWQVNWGKHQSPRFRHVNHIHANVVEDNSDIFPIVMVRDPWSWLQSMCRVRYSAHWFHVPDHCPNFIPNHVEREWFHKTKSFVRNYFHNDPWLVDNVMDKGKFNLNNSSVVPVWVRYKNENAHHDSMAHFWKEWNQEYFEARDDVDDTGAAASTRSMSSFPRLMVRLEDLVFFPQQVLKEICDCVGGQLLSDPMVLVGDTSKKGGENVHGSNKTDLRAAMISHVYTNRSRGMTLDDMVYASNVLKDSPVLQRLGYPSDPRG